MCSSDLGKVRDMYAIPGHDDKLLMVATDRISAFDVIMAEPVPGKGRLLTAISLFWFDLLRDVMPNHLITANVDQYPEVCRQYGDQLEGRSMLVKKSRVVPINVTMSVEKAHHGVRRNLNGFNHIRVQQKKFAIQTMQFDHRTQ